MKRERKTCFRKIVLKIRLLNFMDRTSGQCNCIITNCITEPTKSITGIGKTEDSYFGHVMRRND